MNSTSQLVSLGSITLATCGIMKLLLIHYPCLSIPRAVFVIAETLICLAAVFAQQFRWSGLPDLLFNGFISAACSVEMLESKTRPPKASPPHPAPKP